MTPVRSACIRIGMTWHPVRPAPTWPLDLTRPSRTIYRAAFHGSRLPGDWRVYAVERLHRPDLGLGSETSLTDRYDREHPFLGYCVVDLRTIYLARAAWQYPQGICSPPGSSWLGTLLHEFVHQRHPRLRHGDVFKQLVNGAYCRMWEEATDAG